MGSRIKKQTKVATIYDVARVAEVSTRTVSRVINDLPVSAAVRARVQAAADALSYCPNNVARNLAMRRGFMIGLFGDAAQLGSAYIAQLQTAILTICQQEGLHLVVELIRLNDPCMTAQIQTLASRYELAGVVLTAPLCDSKTAISVLNALNVPIVRISPSGPVDQATDIDIDNHAAGYQMTQYLIELGHRRIGFVRGCLHHADANARFAGYRAALAGAGIAFDERLCAAGNYTYKTGIEAGDILLSQTPRPTAILACNDEMAAGVMAASLRQNLCIPQDLSVAGFDDALIAFAVSPRLTTCRQPTDSMAKIGLNALIHPQQTPEHHILPHRLIIRGTTAPPPAA